MFEERKLIGPNVTSKLPSRFKGINGVPAELINPPPFAWHEYVDLKDRHVASRRRFVGDLGAYQMAESGSDSDEPRGSDGGESDSEVEGVDFEALRQVGMEDDGEPEERGEMEDEI